MSTTSCLRFHCPSYPSVQCGTTAVLSLCTTSVKNNCLKLKSEVGMAVLKSKQTRLRAVYRDNQHIRIVQSLLLLFEYNLSCISE